MKREYASLGVERADSGYVFVDDLGNPLTPEWIIRRFLRLIATQRPPADSPS
jgi:hypothetical protein